MSRRFAAHKIKNAILPNIWWESRSLKIFRGREIAAAAPVSFHAVAVALRRCRRGKFVIKFGQPGFLIRRFIAMNDTVINQFVEQ